MPSCTVSFLVFLLGEVSLLLVISPTLSKKSKSAALQKCPLPAPRTVFCYVLFETTDRRYIQREM